LWRSLPEPYSATYSCTCCPSAQTHGLLVLLGIVVFYVLDATIRARHRTHHHTHTEHRAIPMVLWADGLHNLLDGILIAVAYWADVHIGMATTLAVLVHELPQEFGDFGVLIRSGLSVRKALLFNLLSGLTAIVGAAIGLLLGHLSEDVAQYLIPIATGNFLYLALATLVPMVQGAHSLRRALPRLGVLVLGIVLMWLVEVLTHVEPGGGHLH
jgi:zinc and cadmium transporter